MVDKDALEVAKDLFRPLVLNLASDFRPGGGWKKGSMAQEESIFYRTTYSLSLDREFGYCDITYPLKCNEAVWSPGILVFRDVDHKLMDRKDYFKVDGFAIAALRNPRLTHDHHLNKRDRVITLRKIKLLFAFAREKEYKHLVLGSLGCGCFNNPPSDIAELFREVIAEQPKSSIETVTFAVLSTKSTENFRIFKKILMHADSQ